MTIENERNIVVTDFLLEVTQAENFQELSKAFDRITKDFEQIKKKDSSDKLTVFTDRFDKLALKAKTLLKSNH